MIKFGEKTWLERCGFFFGLLREEKIKEKIILTDQRLISQATFKDHVDDSDSKN